MGCATGVVKYFVFLANLIFALAGLALLGIGIFFKVNYTVITNELPNEFGLAPILCIIVGAVVFITAFFGCCGAVKESPCMLTTYAIILLTIFIIQVAIGVFAFITFKDSDSLHSKIDQPISNVFSKYNTQETSREVVNFIQRTLECCGAKDPSEMRTQNGSYPYTCCKQGVVPCTSTNYNNFYHRPCVNTLVSFLNDSSQIIGGVVIGIAVAEFHCCGAQSPDEYVMKNNNKTLPLTCCIGDVDRCDASDATHVMHDGCVYKIERLFKKSAKVIGGVLIGIGCAELLGAIFGLCLTSSIRNQYRRGMYA